MIRHIALFRFEPSIPDPEAHRILAMFEALDGKIEGLRSVHTGCNCSQEKLDQGFRHGIIMDFEDISALEAYLVHPLHTPIADTVTAKLKNRVGEDIVVFDLRLDPAEEFLFSA